MGSNGDRPPPARYTSVGDDSPTLVDDILNYQPPLP